MGNQSKVLLRATGYDPQRFREAIEQTEPLPQRLNLEQCLAETAQLVGELKTPVRECYLVTDAQATDWQSLSEQAKASLRRITDSASLFLVPVDVDGEENLAVTRFEYASGSLVPAGMARFSAEVRNHGRTTHEGGEATFKVDGQAISRQSLGTIEPGGTKAVSFLTSFDKGGDTTLEFALSPDQLSTDNSRYAVAEVRERIRVLCVDGEPASGGNPSETFYLNKALRLKQIGEDATMDVALTDWQDIAAENFADYDVIVLANVPSVEDGTARRLSRFVSRGGGLVVFAGDRIDVEAYNTGLMHEGNRLLPGQLIEAVSATGDLDSANQWRLGEIDSSHVLASVARMVPQQQLAAVGFNRVMKVESDAEAVVILSLAQPEIPLLLEKRTGRGAVLMFATTADRQWSNFAVHPLYPMLLQQAVTHLTSRLGEKEFAVGDPGFAPITGRKADARVTVEAPGGDRSVRLSMLETGEVICPIETDAPGTYDLLAGEDNNSSIAVNVDPAEADVKVIDSAALAEQLGSLPAMVIPNDENLAAVVENSRSGTELSRMLLIAAMAVFLLQGFLARRFTRKMGEAETDVMQMVHRQTVVAARRTRSEGGGNDQ